MNNKLVNEFTIAHLHIVKQAHNNLVLIQGIVGLVIAQLSVYNSETAQSIAQQLTQVHDNLCNKMHYGLEDLQSSLEEMKRLTDDELV